MFKAQFKLTRAEERRLRGVCVCVCVCVFAVRVPESLDLCTSGSAHYSDLLLLKSLLEYS